MPQNEDNPIALMLVFGAGSALGTILSGLRFPPQCEMPEKTENPPSETSTTIESTDQKPTPQPANVE